MKTVCKAIAMMLGVSIAAAVLSGCSAANAKTEELKKTTVDSFSSIRLDVDVAEVELIPEADAFAIEYHIVNQNVDYSVKSGTLTLKAKGSKTNGVNYSGRSYIKLYVPEDSGFTGIDCKGNVGDIRIGKIEADAMTIDAGVGNVILSDITVHKNLSVKTGVGNIQVDLANDECSYDISADLAKVTINGEEFSGVDVNKTFTSAHGPQVNIATNTGNINFNSK